MYSLCFLRFFLWRFPRPFAILTPRFRTIAENIRTKKNFRGCFYSSGGRPSRSLFCTHCRFTNRVNFRRCDEQKKKESLFDATIKSLLHEREEDGSQTRPDEDGGMLGGGGGGDSSLGGGATSASRQQQQQPPWLTGGGGGVIDQQSLDTGFYTGAGGESTEPGAFAPSGMVSSVNPWS